MVLMCGCVPERWHGVLRHIWCRKCEIMANDNEDIRVKIARQTVEHFVRTGKAPEIDIPAELTRPAAAFVTLKTDDGLRGCIGTLMPTCANQGQEIVQNAISACSRDPRFPAVTTQELAGLHYQVYILKEPEPVKGMEDLDPKRYGVIVCKDHRRGVLLPDLEGVDTVEQQVGIACRKGGINPKENPDLLRFEVETYNEKN